MPTHSSDCLASIGAHPGMPIIVMCGNIEWHTNRLANALQTPNQCSGAPTKKDGNPVEAGLAVRRRNNSSGLPFMSDHMLHHTHPI